ncbi:MAG: hypothetical protein ABSA48_00565 [Terracidiphilus sp.]
MNRTKTNREETDHSRIETILSTEEALIPSSGFLASVMESVHEEARLPQPIPFPWKRAVPGILLASGVFAWAAVELARHALPAVSRISLTPPHLYAALERPLEQAGWVALALAASLLSWLLSRRLAGRSGLL